MDERILYIDREAAYSLNITPGYTPADPEDIAKVAAHFKTGVREALETDETKLQIIPYATIYSPKLNKILVYQRASKHTESRLADKWSIGFGGHTKESESVVDCLSREICEELGICRESHDYVTKFCGFILDNRTEVSRVHLGFHFVIMLDGGGIIADSSEISSLHWAAPTELNPDDFEGWSEILLRNLDKWFRDIEKLFKGV